MYIEEILHIGKTDDGKFLVSVKQKTKKSKDSKNEVIVRPNTEKIYSVDTQEELMTLLKKEIPKLKMGMEEEEYNKAFKE